MNYPGELDDAVVRWLAHQEGGQLRQQTAGLQAGYRAGEASSAAMLAAYLATRLPATFAANRRVMAELAERLPDFAPESVLDCGAGPGTASWAALAQWPSISTVSQLEALPEFRTLCQSLNAASGVPALQSAEVKAADVRHMDDAQFDVVVASFMLAELPEGDAGALAAKLWRQARQVLVLIEPGTPQGFARIRQAREALRNDVHVLAPCTHAQACPMAGTDWCHFKVRLARSRAHMHAKQATVPFEDEAYSYLVVARHAPLARETDGARIIAPVEVNKVSARLHLCDGTGLRQAAIASRNKPAYKRARKAQWGDFWSDAT